MEQKPILIGLTGQSGSGKTSVSHLLRKLGMEVIDCDVVAHQVTSTDPCLSALIEVFGEEMRSKNGGLNRKKLSQLVFSDPEALATLNRTSLPFIGDRILEMASRSYAKFVLLDAPTLLESGLSVHCAFVVSVTAPLAFRKKRILARDDISPEDVENRLNAQPTEFFYTAQSDIVIINEGDLAALQKKANHLFHYLNNMHPTLQKGAQ